MLTASSSTFAAVSKAWLKTTLAHPLLTDANKTFGTALYLYFNVKHFGKTGGELKAWPSWDTLTAEFGLSRTTINESAEQLERCQLLDIKRGRYNRTTQRRAGNEYYARLPSRPQGAEFVPCQGAESVPNPRCAVWTVLSDSPSPHGESRLGESDRAKRGLPSGPSARREEVQARKVTGELEASLNRLMNGGGR